MEVRKRGKEESNLTKQRKRKCELTCLDIEHLSRHTQKKTN